MADRYFGLAKEAVFDTFVVPATYLDQLRDRIVPDQGIIFPDTVNDRDVKKAVLGAFAVRGPVDFTVEPENGIGLFLKTLMGGVSSVNSGDTNAWRHTFEPADTLPSLSVEIGAEEDARQISGVMVDSMEFTMVKKQLVLATANLLAAQEVDGTLTSPTFSTLKPFVFHQAVFEIEDTDTSQIIESARLRMRNNIPYDEAFSFGSRFARRVETGKREIEGEFDLFYDSDAETEMDKFLAGTPSKLAFTIISDEDTGSIDSGFDKYELTFTLPQVYYLRDAVPHPEGRQRQVVTFPFRAVFDDAAGYAISADLVNTNADTIYE